MSKEDNELYITINHLEDFVGTSWIRSGAILTLKKDPDNCCDDEAIAVYDSHGTKCGYVANSVCTVCRGTYSAGRLYDKILDSAKCRVCFIAEDFLIASIKRPAKGQAFFVLPRRRDIP